MAPPVRAVYIGTKPAPTFGLLHPAAPGSERDVAVLMCAPFGWDDAASYRSRRAWAEHLAGAGHPVLRFDLPGTGDSGGSPHDPALVDAWTSAVAEAAGWLRGATGATRVAAIGLGLGGVLACHATAAGAPIDDLVLWAVPARGRTLVREMRAFSRLIDAELGRHESEEPDDAAEPPALPEGALAVSGFVLSAGTAAALEALDLTAQPLPDAPAHRVLMLERPGMGVDERLRDHLQQSGADVTVMPGPGYAAITDHPQHRRPPIPEFETVTTWLASVASPAAPSRPDPPSEHDRVELNVDGVRIRETPLTIEQPAGRLFGIVTEPVEGAPADFCAVLFNSGAIRRIGPNRMWVEIARRWAARGVRTVRIDLEGIGDADGDSDRYEDTGELYSDRLTDQALAVLDALEQRGLPPRFLLAGLCSGAFWSFHGALRDDRVTAAFMLNLRAVFWDSSLDAVRDARRAGRLLRGTGVSWGKALRAIRVARLLGLARVAVRAVTGLPRRTAKRRADARRADDAFDRLRDTGKTMLFVFSKGEDLYEELQAAGHFDDLERWPNMQLKFAPGWDHDLRPPASQRRAHEILDEALERLLERELPGGGARVPGGRLGLERLRLRAPGDSVSRLGLRRLGPSTGSRRASPCVHSASALVGRGSRGPRASAPASCACCAPPGAGAARSRPARRCPRRAAPAASARAPGGPARGRGT